MHVLKYILKLLIGQRNSRHPFLRIEHKSIALDCIKIPKITEPQSIACHNKRKKKFTENVFIYFYYINAPNRWNYKTAWDSLHCYTDDTQLYLSLNPENNPLYRLQACLDVLMT